MSLIALLLLLAAPASAKNKVQHKAVEAPTWAVPTVSVAIGTVTDMKAGDGVLVLAGQEGVAAVDAAGTVLWSTPLPWAMVRNVAIDGEEVAFTAWTLAGIEDKGKALNAWASGELMDKFQVEGATVGLLGAGGALAWSIEASDDLPLAPPGLADGVVVVNCGKRVVTYGRADGAEIGRFDMPGTQMSSGMFAGVFDHATRGEVVPVGDSLFTSFFSFFVKLDRQGNLVDKEFKAGLTPYVDITCGPVQLDDLLVFGTTGDTQVESGFFSMRDDMKNQWKTWSSDKSSGCGDMVTDGERVYASSNFWVMALDAKGKLVWESVNKKGGLFPSQNRGIRYVGSFGARKTYGDLLVVGGGRVFVGTDNGHDVITVLDAATGEYVKTIDVNETLVSMTVVGDRLAVATDQGLHLMDLGS